MEVPLLQASSPLSAKAGRLPVPRRWADPLIRFPHVTRCPAPGNWAPGISSPGADRWPSFPFSAAASPIPVPGVCGPLPRPWFCRCPQPRGGEMSCHLGSQTCAPALGCAGSLSGGFRLVSIQNLMPDGSLRDSQPFWSWRSLFPNSSCSLAP